MKEIIKLNVNPVSKEYNKMLLAVCSKKERQTNYLKRFATDITAKSYVSSSVCVGD